MLLGRVSRCFISQSRNNLGLVWLPVGLPHRVPLRVRVAVSSILPHGNHHKGQDSFRPDRGYHRNVYRTRGVERQRVNSLAESTARQCLCASWFASHCSIAFSTTSTVSASAPNEPEKQAESQTTELRPLEVCGDVPSVAEVAMWLEKESASNVVVLDISDKATFVDNFIVATGMTLNHVRHLADTMQKRLRERGVFVEGAEPFIEGRDSDDWMLLDLGRFVIHIMTPDGRERYQLENLWAGSEAEGVSSWAWWY